MDTGCEASVEVSECPEGLDEIECQIQRTVDDLIRFVKQDTLTLKLIDFEQALWPRITLLFRLGVALFLSVRHRRLDLTDDEGNGWRVKQKFAQRTIKTLCGPVRYGRAYLTRRNGGGWFPLDAALGITTDGFSLRVIDLAIRLATRLSDSATRGTMQGLLGWSPSIEAIERLVIGVGRRRSWSRKAHSEWAEHEEETRGVAQADRVL